MPRDPRIVNGLVRDLEAQQRKVRERLALLEATRDELIRADEHRCDEYSHRDPCDGVVSARFCRCCGAIARRCEQHGGLRGATHQHVLHLAAEHGENIAPIMVERARDAIERAKKRRARRQRLARDLTAAELREHIAAGAQDLAELALLEVVKPRTRPLATTAPADPRQPQPREPERKRVPIQPRALLASRVRNGAPRPRPPQPTLGARRR